MPIGNAQKVFAVFFAIAILINCVTIKDGHNWGGDFSQYLIHAKNIIEHKPFAANIALENYFSYPPGFPLLIAPIVKMCGINFKLLKLLNVFFWYLSLIALYEIFRKRLSQDIALLCCALLAVSSEIFIYKQNVLTDIPFFFFISWAFWFWDRAEREKTSGPWTMFLVCLSLATLIRTAGYILFLATVLYLVIKNRDFWRAGMACVAMALVAVIHGSISGVHPSFFTQVVQAPGQFFQLIMNAYTVPLKTLLYFFLPGQTGLTEKMDLYLFQLAGVLSVVLYIAMTVVFIRQMISRKISLSGVFVFLYLLAMLFWSGFESRPQTLTRIALPIVGLILMLGCEYLGRGGRPGSVLTKSVLYGLIALNLWNIQAVFNFNDDVLLKKENQELFSWVKANVGEQEHYLFWGARPMALLTGRVGAAPWGPGSDLSTFGERLKKLNIAYVVATKAVDGPIVSFFAGNPSLAQAVWENEAYLIFKTENSAR